MRMAALLALLHLGCGLSTTGGTMGLVDFYGKECGAALGGLMGCDLRSPLAAGAKVDVEARLRRDGTLLTLRSANQALLSIEPTASGGTLVGRTPGTVDLWAQWAGQDVDRLPITVEIIGQFAYSKLSDASGTFIPTPQGETDGTFEVARGLRSFGLVLGQIGTSGRQLIGRDSATYALAPGLTLVEGRGSPAALHFEFHRPAPGSYPLEVRARVGGAQANILIVVRE
ncbi:MAG: hypothetical protein RMK29_05385 [Myxococcales bacterium]|nr:hypothetical protein [Myxococcota bacterium]MDW8281124.1 hypothetical protein [Myxococcales bacterium]